MHATFRVKTQISSNEYCHGGNPHTVLPKAPYLQLVENGKHTIYYNRRFFGTQYTVYYRTMHHGNLTLVCFEQQF